MWPFLTPEWLPLHPPHLAQAQCPTIARLAILFHAAPGLSWDCDRPCLRKKWGWSSDSLRYHRKHSATGLLLHLSRDRGVFRSGHCSFGWNDWEWTFLWVGLFACGWVGFAYSWSLLLVQNGLGLSYLQLKLGLVFFACSGNRLAVFTYRSPRPEIGYGLPPP